MYLSIELGKRHRIDDRNRPLMQFLFDPNSELLWLRVQNSLMTVKSVSGEITLIRP